VSVGELVDRITILEIKFERIKEPARKADVQTQLAALRVLEAGLAPYRAKLETTISQLKTVNRQLWEAEDQIRLCEARADFGKNFVKLARSIYLLNDERSRLKTQLNLDSGSHHFEEKLYNVISQTYLKFQDWPI
jgi:uncharacterized small protein (DUF1192 family)